MVPMVGDENQPMFDSHKNHKIMNASEARHTTLHKQKYTSQNKNTNNKLYDDTGLKNLECHITKQFENQGFRFEKKDAPIDFGSFWSSNLT